LLKTNANFSHGEHSQFCSDIFLQVRSRERSLCLRRYFRGLTTAIIQTFSTIVRELSWRENKRTVALCSVLRAQEERKSREVLEKSIARSGARRSWSFMSACYMVDPADNFFPSVKSLSSPPAFSQKRNCVLGRRKTRYEVSESFTLSDVFAGRVIPAVATALPPPRVETESFRQAERRYNFNHLSAKQHLLWKKK